MATIIPCMDQDTQDFSHTAWHRACSLAADALAATQDPRRLALGLGLAQAHKVTLTLTEEQEDYAQVASGRKIYSITTAGKCPCEDAHRGHTCKHLLAVMITQNAIPFGGSVETLAEEAFLATPAEEPVQAAQSLPPAPTPHIQIDNPAGFNFKARVGNGELWYTFHDVSDERLMARLSVILPQLQEMVAEAEERLVQRQKTQKASPPPEVMIDGSGILPRSTSNGTKPHPDTNDTNREWCSVHQVEMTFYPANERGPGWYSHRLGQGGYCRGGN